VKKLKIKKSFQNFCFQIDETLDKYGLLILGISIVLILAVIIVPWFFSRVLGSCVIMGIIGTMIIIMILIDETVVKVRKVLLIISMSPYILLGLIPTIIITIVRKKEKKLPTILELRYIKVNRLKKKVRYNKLKFWKKKSKLK